MNGADVLLYVNGDVVGSQTNVKFDEKTAEIDMSSKDGRAKRVIAGRYSATVTLDALYLASDTAYGALKSAMRDGTLVTIVRQDEETTHEEADAVVTSLSEAAPDQDAVKVSVDLAIDGEWAQGS